METINSPLSPTQFCTHNPTFCTKRIELQNHGRKQANQINYDDDKNVNTLLLQQRHS